MDTKTSWLIDMRSDVQRMFIINTMRLLSTLFLTSETTHLLHRWQPGSTSGMGALPAEVPFMANSHGHWYKHNNMYLVAVTYPLSQGGAPSREECNGNHILSPRLSPIRILNALLQPTLVNTRCFLINLLPNFL